MCFSEGPRPNEMNGMPFLYLFYFIKFHAFIRQFI